jgi:hypothetical protein
MSESVELDARREPAAKNQSMFREVNERIGQLSGSATLPTFVCECTDETCDQRLPLTRGVRADPLRLEELFRRAGTRSPRSSKSLRWRRGMSSSPSSTGVGQ